MTSMLSRFALGLGLSAALLAMPVLAQTTTTETPAATVADGISMGVPDGMPDRANAAEGQMYLAASFDAWELRCGKMADEKDPCQLYQLLKDETGNPTAEVSFFALPAGGAAVLGASVLVPLETLLTANLRIGVDKAVAKVYPLSYCTVAGCIAKVGFAAEDVAGLKAGTVATVSIVPAAAPDKVVSVGISLKGFTAGYQALVDAQAKLQ